MFDNPDTWFSGTPRKTKKSAGAGGGVTIQSNRSPATKKQLLNSIKATNNNKPQVMVKISGASKGTDKAQAHVNYIGRKGEIEIENQDGEKFNGKENQKYLLKSWEAMGMHSDDKTGKRKEAFHFVFSMPKGTNSDALKIAVKNLVKQEFDGHKYFMAQHLDTDSPHVHVLVAATDDRGARLNPRKADLHNYRIQFAHKLQEQGIEATASRRIHRFKYKDSIKQSEIHKMNRNNEKIIEKSPSNLSKIKIDKTHNDVYKIYKDFEKKLSVNDELKSEINKITKDRERGKEIER